LNDEKIELNNYKHLIITRIWTFAFGFEHDNRSRCFGRHFIWKRQWHNHRHLQIPNQFAGFVEGTRV
jgi:hypothetical protein